MQTHTAYPPLPAEFARDGNFTGTAAAVLFAAAYWYVIVRPSEQ